MQEKIAQARIMQLATVSGAQPWICTVYFVLNDGRFYWLSFPDRRHSKDLANNVNAAIAIALKYEAPVVGIQAEGDVSIVDAIDEVTIVLDKYIEKYGKGKQFIENFQKGTNRHVLYRFIPRTVMLFDEHNTPDDPYQEILLS